jgi:hypothetical protein
LNTLVRKWENSGATNVLLRNTARKPKHCRARKTHYKTAINITRDEGRKELSSSTSDFWGINDVDVEKYHWKRIVLKVRNFKNYCEVKSALHPYKRESYILVDL